MKHLPSTQEDNPETEPRITAVSNKNMIKKQLTSKFDLVIFYINMRSAREKLDDVNNQALANNADLVILSETWFYQDRNFLLVDFELITQKDRANTKDGHSGGVAIYVRRNIADFFQELSLKSTYTKGIDDVQICAVK